ncbi:MAG: aminoacyl-tRNA hydrolase [Ornithinimicrobium sp.]
MQPWLIVGLGNPGGKYAAHRHNVGAMSLAVLAAEAGAQLKAHKTRSSLAQVRIGVLPGGMPGPPAILVQPQTYMNLSGGPVASAASFFSIPIERIVVLHDELDIDFGTVRLKRGGGEGGHNGLRSITSALGTREYARIRLGVGRPPGRQDPADYVLSNFPARDSEEVALLVADGADAAQSLVHDGLEVAQQRFHSR